MRYITGFSSRSKNRLAFSFFFTILSVLSPSAIDATVIDDVMRDVGACIVINADNGKVLVQKNAYEKRLPASCTKVATLSYILSRPNLNLNQKIIVPPEAVKILNDAEKARDNFYKHPSYIQEATGTSARFVKGEEVSLRDALYGMMLVSGNDAANTLAYHFGNGSIQRFMDDLNSFVTRLGCRSTHFMNPHGLHHPEHVSSAYDLALISWFGMKNLPIFSQIVGSKSYTKPQTNKQVSTTWLQANKLLRQGRFYCEWATGIKTGRHMRAMENIVVSGEKNGRKIILVLMQCPERTLLYQHARKMLIHFLDEKPTVRTLVTQGPIQLTKEMPGGDPLPLKAGESFSFQTYQSEMPEIKVSVIWKPSSISVKKDECVGDLSILLDGKEAKKIPLYAAEARKMTIPSLLHHIGEKISLTSDSKNHPANAEGMKSMLFWSMACFSALIGILIIRRFLRNSQKRV